MNLNQPQILLGLVMSRELGPVMAAIMLAGRSGSAFAAELGTMKVNEELNALQTMFPQPQASLWKRFAEIRISSSSRTLPRPALIVIK